MWEAFAKIVGYSLLAYWAIFYKKNNDTNSKK